MSNPSLLEMIEALVDWIDALPPGVAFLFALPFLIAAIGLAADAWRARRRHPPMPRHASRPRASMKRTT